MDWKHIHPIFRDHQKLENLKNAYNFWVLGTESQVEVPSSKERVSYEWFEFFNSEFLRFRQIHWNYRRLIIRESHLGVHFLKLG